ncbi:hypothetical protein KCP78_23410 [Salmonella enterica subsp. enterica]|nr:hypothetical protein KCP78_23410 [Salmonella enterica subsp. enterica]
MLIAQQKPLNVVDDFAGVEDGDGFGSPSEREVFSSRLLIFPPPAPAWSANQTVAHQVVVPRRRSRVERTTARWRCGSSVPTIASTS